MRSYTCPHCSWQIRAPETLRGQRVLCPHCQREFVAGGVPEAGGTATVRCPCGALLSVPRGPAVQRVVCPTCGRRLLIEHRPQRRAFACPACGRPVPRGAVLCTSCGTDLRTGRRQLTRDRGGVAAEVYEISSWVWWVSLILPFAVVPYTADGKHLEAVSQQHLHVVTNDVQLAVVSLVEEAAAAALLAAQGVIALEQEEAAGADSPGSDESLIPQGSVSQQSRHDGYTPKSHSGCRLMG